MKILFYSSILLVCIISLFTFKLSQNEHPQKIIMEIETNDDWEIQGVTTTPEMKYPPVNYELKFPQKNKEFFYIHEKIPNDYQITIHAKQINPNKPFFKIKNYSPQEFFQKFPKEKE